MVVYHIGHSCQRSNSELSNRGENIQHHEFGSIKITIKISSIATVFSKTREKL